MGKFEKNEGTKIRDAAAYICFYGVREALMKIWPWENAMKPWKQSFSFFQTFTRALDYELETSIV